MEPAASLPEKFSWNNTSARHKRSTPKKEQMMFASESKEVVSWSISAVDVSCVIIDTNCNTVSHERAKHWRTNFAATQTVSNDKDDVSSGRSQVFFLTVELSSV